MLSAAHLTQMAWRTRDNGWHHPWLGLLFFVLVAVALGVGLWAVLRASRPTHHVVGPGASPDPAMDMLRMRFARGEINADEYAARAAQLSGLVPPGSPQPPGTPAGA